MKIYTLIGSVIVAFSIGVVLVFVGCATTGSTVQSGAASGEAADIDELLGLKESGTKEEQSDEIAEDDVLRLLGVVEETEKKPSQVQAQEMAAAEEIQKMESEQVRLDQQEKALRQEISQQQKQVSTAQQTQSAAATKTKDAAAPAWKASSFQDRYQEARQDYGSRKYLDAIQKFEALISMEPRHSLTDNCQYWIGESYYGLGNFRQAIVAFEKVFTYTDSNKDADAQLKLGLCYMRLNDTEKARGEFQKLINNYPASEYVSMAKRYLAQLQ